MKTLKYITLACFALSLTFASCESYEQEQYKDNGSNDQLAHQPLGDLDIHPMGDSVTVSYTSAVDWDLTLGYTNTREVEMLDVGNANCDIKEKLSGSAGTTTFTIVIKEYLDATNNVSNDKKSSVKTRYLTLTFKDKDGNHLSLYTISQSQPYLWIDGHDKNVFSLDYNTLEQDITIESNIDWEIKLDSNNDFILMDGANEINAGTTMDGNKTLTCIPKNGFNYSKEEKQAKLLVSPCSRKWSDDECEKINHEVIDTWEYTITQDYRVMFLTTDEPTDENWASISSIDEIDGLSPFGTNHLDDESAAIAEFYCIYDIKNERPAPNMQVENTYNNDAEFFAVDEPFEVTQIDDDRYIMAQKYNVAVITPNTDLTTTRPMNGFVMDNDNEVQKLTVVQGHFDFSLQYEDEDSGEPTNVPNTIHYSYTAGDKRQFSVETNEASLKWTLGIDNSAFSCDGLGEHSGSSGFTISTSDINYYISQPQEAEVSISPTLDGVGELQTITFNLEQEAFLFKFTDSDSDSDATSKEISFAVDEESATVKFNSYGDLDISVSNDYSWLEAATESSDTDNEYEIALTIKTSHTDFENQKNRNIGIPERSETVNIVSKVHAEDKDKHRMKESDYTKTIIVKQDAYEFKVKKDKIEAPADGGSFDVGVTCTNTYTYSVGADSKDWISVTKTGNNGIKITVAKNETTKVRDDGIVTIKDTKFNNSYEITVTQEAGEEPEEPEDDNGGGVIE